MIVRLIIVHSKQVALSPWNKSIIICSLFFITFPFQSHKCLKTHLNPPLFFFFFFENNRLHTYKYNTKSEGMNVHCWWWARRKPVVFLYFFAYKLSTQWWNLRQRYSRGVCNHTNFLISVSKVCSQPNHHSKLNSHPNRIWKSDNILLVKDQRLA